MKISVITVTWNSAATIRHTIDSFLAQSWQDAEMVVVDGASTDATVAIVESYGEARIRLRSEPDRGIFDAMNKGLARYTGDAVGFLNSDDRYHDRDVLARIAEGLAGHDIVHGDLDFVRDHERGEVIRRWRGSAYRPGAFRRGWMPPHPTLYVRRSWYDRIGGFDLRYRIAADYFSILQLFSSPDFRAAYLPRVLVRMRVGGASNRSLSNIMRKSREDLDALRRTGVGGLGTLLWKNASKLGQFVVRPT